MSSHKRACIKYTPRLSTKSQGRRPAYMNPGFQVPNQNEPTPANPISQHKQFKGHSAGGGGRIGRVTK